MQNSAHLKFGPQRRCNFRSPAVTCPAFQQGNTTDCKLPGTFAAQHMGVIATMTAPMLLMDLLWSVQPDGLQRQSSGYGREADHVTWRGHCVL